MGAAIARLLLDSPDHSCSHRWRSGTRLAASMTAFEACHTVLLEPHFPARHRRSTGLHPARYLSIRDAFGQSEQESRTKHIPGGQCP